MALKQPNMRGSKRGWKESKRYILIELLHQTVFNICCLFEKFFEISRATSVYFDIYATQEAENQEDEFITQGHNLLLKYHFHNQLAFISYIVVYRPFQELISYSSLVRVSSNFLSDHLLSV